ncbi:MAG: hypothetical protein HN509_10835 [Halobacteriovoraceae bacterium]|jgi:hypothetical protein|nr:hypothetical protein [Halobacteriovoraceae bacterium]MBT5092907.1 hypothetical protein [Halobacteriovoraceae bacterium]
MSNYGECWCCDSPAIGENKNGLAHCANCYALIMGYDENGEGTKTCSCKGPPGNCHRCLEYIKWGGVTVDEDGDSTKRGSCACKNLLWTQVKFVEPPSTETNFRQMSGDIKDQL